MSLTTFVVIRFAGSLGALTGLFGSSEGLPRSEIPRRVPLRQGRSLGDPSDRFLRGTPSINEEQYIYQGGKETWCRRPSLV